MSAEPVENARSTGASESAAKAQAFNRVAEFVASANSPAAPSGDLPDTPEGRQKAADLRALMHLFPLTIKGMGRHIDAIQPAFARSLGPRHGAALRQLSEGPLTVGALAGRLYISLSTASGLLAELDREALIVRSADPADRRRTIVEIHPDRRVEVDLWLSDFASPLREVLDALNEDERGAFIKAMQVFADIVAPDGVLPQDCAVKDVTG